MPCSCGADDELGFGHSFECPRKPVPSAIWARYCGPYETTGLVLSVATKLSVGDRLTSLVKWDRDGGEYERVPVDLVILSMLTREGQVESVDPTRSADAIGVRAMVEGEVPSDLWAYRCHFE